MSQITLPIPNRSFGLASRPFAQQPALVFSALVFSMVVFLAMAISLAWWQGPGLLRDWRISQNPVTVEDWDLLVSECNARRFTVCKMDMAYTIGGQDYEKHITLAFFDFSDDNYTVDLVIDADNPDLATLSLGLDMLWNRTITFSVFMLLLCGWVFASVSTALFAARANKAAANPGRLSVMPVHVTQIRELQGRTLVTYSAGKKKRVRTMFARGEEPLMAIDEAGKLVGVGVRLDHMAVPVLLDSTLQRIQMTESERRTALAAFYDEQAPRGNARVANRWAAGAARSASARARAKTKAVSPARRGLWIAGWTIAFAVAVVLSACCYWLSYVLIAPETSDYFGMEFNNMMPEALNTWGCEQLYERFGDEPAPHGCGSSEDLTRWKVAPKSGKVK